MSSNNPLDHWLLARRYPLEVERARCALVRAFRSQGTRLYEMSVAHDDDGRCCRLEPWPVTLAELLALLPPGTTSRRAPESHSPPDLQPN